MVNLERALRSVREFSLKSDLGKIVRGWSLLSGGNMLASIMSLGAIIVAARALGPEQYGLLATVQALALFISAIFEFKTDIAVIRFGVEVLEDDREDDFLRLIKGMLVVDMVTAVAALLSAWAVIALAGEIFEIGDDLAWTAGIFCLVLLTGLKGVPAGLLRMFDRYALVPMREVLGAFLRLFFALVLAIAAPRLDLFLVTWFVAEAAANVLFFWLAFRELGRNGHRNPFFARGSLRFIRAAGVLRVLWHTTAASALRLGSERADILFVSALLGPTAVGIFNVAKSFANILVRLCDTVQYAVAPQYSRLWVRGELAALRRTNLVVGGMALALTAIILVGLFFTAPLIIRVAFGTEYLASAPVLLALTAAYGVMLLGNLYMSALVAMDRAQAVMWISFVSAAALFAPMPWLLSAIGVMGASFAHGARAFTWTIATFIVNARTLRHQAYISSNKIGEIDQRLSDGRQENAKENSV